MATDTETLLILAGDPSGDLHGAGLAKALKRESPRLRIAAVGGRHLRAASDEFLHDLASHGIVGFVEPVRKVPMLLALAGKLWRFMSERRPAVVVVDYYGFNRRALGLAKRLGLDSFYFISPQVWATRPGRIKVIGRLVKRVLVIFPFEIRLYHDARVPVTFVGHPLLDVLPEPRPAEPALLPGRLRLGLLPGSRRAELSRHLPMLLGAAEIIKQSFPNVEMTVFAASHLPEDAYAAAVKAGARIVRDQGYAERRELDMALTSSGTATLENALLGIPMVVVYQTSWPTYLIARALIRVPFISMANILAGKRLVPEFVQRDATPHAVANAALGMLKDTKKLVVLRQELAAIRSQLGGPGACSRAAREILKTFTPLETVQ